MYLKTNIIDRFSPRYDDASALITNPSKVHGGRSQVYDNIVLLVVIGSIVVSNVQYFIV